MVRGRRTRKIFILVSRAFASNFVYKHGSTVGLYIVLHVASRLLKVVGTYYFDARSSRMRLGRSSLADGGSLS